MPYKNSWKFCYFNVKRYVPDLLTAICDTVIHGIERTMGYMDVDNGDHTHYMLILIEHSVLCTLQRGLSNACCLASNYILCAASLDRALVVAKPMLNFRRGKIGRIDSPSNMASWRNWFVDVVFCMHHVSI